CSSQREQSGDKDLAAVINEHLNGRRYNCSLTAEGFAASDRIEFSYISSELPFCRLVPIYQLRDK
ncbi:hypothetical protein, partial [Paenibacillus terreus]|uniref:hypothetical protein n=1 Tax=Paenibacillus terreus TaxID=1387834 RepID=UPI0035CCD7CE